MTSRQGHGGHSGSRGSPGQPEAALGCQQGLDLRPRRVGLYAAESDSSPKAASHFHEKWFVSLTFQLRMSCIYVSVLLSGVCNDSAIHAMTT